jgi:transcription-repair coupling factor (superfamily II helicase)
LSKKEIVNQYQKSAKTQQVLNEIQLDQNHFQITNLVGSSLSFVISETFKKAEKPYLLVFNDKEEAAYYLNDLDPKSSKYV